jgi:hypothetical protein
VSDPLAKAALNVASLHSIVGYALHIPKLGGPENPRLTTGIGDGRNVGKVLKVIPTAVVTCVSGSSGYSAWSAGNG